MSEGYTLLRRVSAFLNEAEMPPSLFGREAVRDPQFVFDLRRGRNPGRKVVTRADAYMQAWRNEHR
ncbi:hypothetical protein [Sphingopyxis sp. GW247-27LB]|uniref:hypothetical protein n=1 Tax=Sphingopyxis sp. GW247-27LB TaxID=2012632 RepID=UPI000BA7A2FF|nr:hypothetical protein [Sphingopyxis sp. GW247-27LB]PAL24531.1 hypothetical protein CD928_03795 [Sphingopyxis sp. GW247-27LB]